MLDTVTNDPSSPHAGLGWVRTRIADGAAGEAAAQAAAIAAGVFVLAFISLNLPGEQRQTIPVWMPNALALACLVRSPIGRWPLIVLAASAGNVLVDLAVGDPLTSALALTLVNVLEFGGCAAVLRWRSRGEVDLTQTSCLIWFVAVAGVLAPFVSALLARFVLDHIEGAPVQVDLALWSLGDALGLLILTPAFLAIGRLRLLLLERPLTPRGMLSLGVLLLLSALVFGQSTYPLLFVLPPALLWVAFELEILGAAVGLILMSAMAIVFTAQGEGPILIIQGGVAHRSMVLQVFLASTVLLTIAAASARTQRRRLQEAMVVALSDAQDQARRARMAEQVAGVGYWRLDAATKQITWSEQMYRVFGLAPGGPPDLEAAMAMVHPDDSAASNARLAHALQSGEGWDDPMTRIIQPGGELRYVSGRAVCETDGRGRVTAVFGTLADVTEQKLAELALAESEARYRLLAENASDTILHTDLDATVSYASPAVEAFTGRPVQAIIGRRWRDFIHPEDLRAISARGARARRAGKAYQPKWMEYRIARPDGRIVWVEARPTFVIDPVTGQPCGITDVIRDITERKTLEAELTAALAEAEAAAAVKTEFLANMSHELRTPITAVLGFSKLLEDEPDLRSDARRYVSRVSSASKALLATVNDILDFSKLEAGQVEIKRRPEAPATPAREAIEMFAAEAAGKGIEFCLEGADSLPATLAIDSDRLRQMLLNLVSNAVKFTEQGTVRLQVVHDPANGRLSYAVMDTGPGIEPDKLKQLFQRFSQIDGSTTRRHGGTGLGLAICKGLAEAMGGEIGVESTPGQGARFWFWIPADSDLITVDPIVGDRPPTLPAGCRVLVVDDNSANRDLARCLLEPFGAAVQEAVDGQSGVEMAQQAPFDVILMDVRMPGLDGPGAMRLIRKGDGPNQATPILAFSADVGSAGGPDFKAMGFDGQIGKPLTALDLIIAIAALLQPQSPLPKAASGGD